MKRALLAAVLVTGMLAASGPGEVGRAQPPAPPPNFVVIVTDDQRADTMDVMPKTNQWFGSSGRRFTNGYATTPLCCPSRSSIFSGRYAHNHRVRTNKNTSNLDQETTVQYYLQSMGYRTALFGKYLNRWHKDPPYFDDWAVPGTRKYYTNTWNIDGQRHFVSKYSTVFLAEEAVTFVNDAERDDPTPWLMFITPQASHEPFTVEAQYSDAEIPGWDPDPSINERNVSDKPNYIRNKDRVNIGRPAQTRELQLKTLLSVDDLVDNLFTKLSATGELENTYLFFMSDHGYSWADHRLFSAGALKNTPYTNSVKVPYLMYDPTLASGTDDDRLVANIDIAPTLMDLADAPSPQEPAMDGRSLLSGAAREWLLLEWWKARGQSGIPPWRSIRSKDAQYIEYLRKGKVFDREYYRLLEDPYQLENVLGDGAKRNDPDRRALHRKLRQYSRCGGETCP
jgi:arylsulfatase A-like enzyme